MMKGVAAADRRPNRIGMMLGVHTVANLMSR